ncbi:hypothetical protein [Ramlibacter pallidus]|uniref:DUF4124 domain-containing protein n=1 Tax=Ramlibacter pallidus TaxID=2780087 RepID=A0ABR9S1Z4_9BURK|nr:hypothetical protein [Ramlibacter pallidus]MBE7367542.1 hypothetical protein [Ramlibacter pallidus]
MQLALPPPAFAPVPPPASRDLTRIVRPWALLAGLLAAYSVYTAFDGLPGLLQHAARVAPGIALRSVTGTVSAAPLPASRLQWVTRCEEDGATRYTDGDCAGGATSTPLIVTPDPAPSAPTAAVAQLCAEVGREVLRIALKAGSAPSEAERLWLLDRHHDARREQQRLGC